MYKRLIEKQAPDLDNPVSGRQQYLFSSEAWLYRPASGFLCANEHNFYHDTFLYKEVVSLSCAEGRPYWHLLLL